MKKLLSVIVAVILFPSFEKSSGNNNCMLSGASIIGSWAIASATYKRTPNSPSTDIYHDTSWFFDCEKDDYTTFNPNGTYNYFDAGTSCNADGNLSGEWSLSGDTLYTNKNYISTASIISGFSCNTIMLTHKGYDTTGDEAIITYKRLINK